MEKSEIAEKTREAIGKAAEGGKQIAVPFSGGLDSSIIAQVLKGRGDVLLITVGTKESDDVQWASRHSRQFAGKHIVHILGDDEIAKIYGVLKNGFGFGFLACDVLVAFYKACEIAKENGCGKIICGAGAEEVFIGYRKYLEEAGKGKKTVSEIRRGAVAFWHSENGDGKKIRKVAGEFGLEVEFPFLDEKVVEAAEKIADDKHLPEEDGLSKPVLREVAKELGVPEEIVLRPKKAMQYGSGVHKALMAMKKAGKI